MTVFDLKDSFQYAMHGNGAYKGLRQTNTKDAMKFWYSKGVRIFEIDIAKTDDNKYVAVAHDLQDKSLRRLEIFNPPKQRTRNWFMSQKLFSISTKGLEPLSLESIVDFLNSHLDAIIMFDLFGLFEYDDTYHFTSYLTNIIGRNSLWDRILIEAYNTKMAVGIRKGNEKASIIFCARYEKNLYNSKCISAKKLLDYNIHFVSYPWYCASYHSGEIKAYSEAGITVFSRTKFNTKNEMLKASGVAVNIIANRFDHIKIVYQYPLYMSLYIKRIVIKTYIKLKYKFLAGGQ